METRRDERRSRGERSRQAILGAALAVLGELGSEGFTARRVAERAGVSPGNLFHHFSSLDELLLEAVMLMLDESFVERMKGTWPDVRTYLQALGANGLGLIRERPEAVNLFITLIGKVPFHERLRHKSAEYYTHYVAWLEGELAKLDASGAPRERLHNLAVAVLMLLDGMSIHWSIHRDPDELERFWNEMAALFSQRLAPAGPPP